jgi:hypothetical protein
MLSRKCSRDEPSPKHRSLFQHYRPISEIGPISYMAGEASILRCTLHPEFYEWLSNRRPESMSEKLYVFDYYLFVSRRGHPTVKWIWEVRRKSKPDQRYFSTDGFRSAKAAEEAGKIILAEVRKAYLEERAARQWAMAEERKFKIARRMEKAAAEAAAMVARNTPERRSENARIAALARAKSLSWERRLEIAQKAGAASKGKPKVKKHFRPSSDSR